MYHSVLVASHSTVLFRYCIAFEMIGCFGYQLMVMTDR